MLFVHLLLIFFLADCTASPYSILDPAYFADLLGEDLSWAKENIPLFQSSNKTLEAVYYFRWRLYRSHIHPTNRTDRIDWVVTEFSPQVPNSPVYNTINCAAGHHLAEGGWMRNTEFMDSYTRWWASGEPQYHYYYWPATAILRNYERGAASAQLLHAVVPSLVRMFALYANGTLPDNDRVASGFNAPNDCLWNFPGNEGQEKTLSGPGCRTLVQSLMFGEASALARLCAAIGDAAGADAMQAEAVRWRRRVLALWNPELRSFDTLRLRNASAPRGEFAGVRELASLSSPWFFGAVPAASAGAYAASWEAAFDPLGFAAPFGLRTAERRAKGYSCDLPRSQRYWRAPCCYWSGPMWPFETSKLISAAVRVLNQPDRGEAVPAITGARLWSMLWQYTQAHTSQWRVRDVTTDGFVGNLSSSPLGRWLFNGTGELWLAESGCADGGDDDQGLDGPAWTDDATRGYRYNHATFVDLVLSGVVGLQPHSNGTLVVNPLVPAEVLPWWAADGIALHGHIVAVAFDADGTRYKRQPGLSIWVDGKLALTSPQIGRVSIQLDTPRW